MSDDQDKAAPAVASSFLFCPLWPWIAIGSVCFMLGMATASWLMCDPEDATSCLLAVGSTAFALLTTIQCCHHSHQLRQDRPPNE